MAPASEVPYQSRTTGTRTQLKAAQRTTSVALSSAGVRGPDMDVCSWAAWAVLVVINAAGGGRSLVIGGPYGARK
ncbi:hypothetical protein [Streptomyces sp. Y7]|uniref:hypothetical protein n=1 Tax=Streptomyces sp. Y7 TaxID=3342392 RepID=UPI00371E54AD